MRFNEGDVVNRKCGGPLMTVEDIRDDDLVAVLWFDGNALLHRDCFHPSVLQKWQRVDD